MIKWLFRVPPKVGSRWYSTGLYLTVYKVYGKWVKVGIIPEVTIPVSIRDLRFAFREIK